MTIFIFWVLCCIAAAALLSPHERAGTGCLLGGLLGPFGILFAWIEKNRLDRQLDARRSEIQTTELRRAIAARDAEETPPREERDCPFCAEKILVRATVCRFCQREVMSPRA